MYLFSDQIFPVSPFITIVVFLSIYHKLVLETANLSTTTIPNGGDISTGKGSKNAFQAKGDTYSINRYGKV